MRYRRYSRCRRYSGRSRYRRSSSSPIGRRGLHRHMRCCLGRASAARATSLVSAWIVYSRYSRYGSHGREWKSWPLAGKMEPMVG